MSSINRLVSDVLKDFILDIFETGKANPRVYDSVPPLFERIASGAGVFQTLKLKKTVTNEDRAEMCRFELLEEEFVVGNNSTKLLQELRRFIIKFMSEGKVARKQGMNLLMELFLG